MPAPTTPNSRAVSLDALRGAAIIGILVVNVALIASPPLFEPSLNVPRGGADGLSALLLGLAGWLAAGKFLALLAGLFGVGLGLITARAATSNHLPFPSLIRRSAFLIVLGLTHMVLLFPGDILFAYGATSLIALLFLRLRPRALLACAGSLTLAYLVLATSSVMAGGSASRGDGAVGAAAADGFANRNYVAILAANTQSTLNGQDSGIWVAVFALLPLFLVGIAAARAGVATRPDQHRRLLQWIAGLGFGIGLPANAVFFSAGLFPAIGIGTSDLPINVRVLFAWVGILGVPLLAAGYASAAVLWWQRRTPPTALVAMGRMALTAYVAQSALVVSVVFIGGLYGHLSYTQMLILCAVVGGTLLVACSLWLRFFAFGPLEWMWRAWTYLTVPPWRQHRARDGQEGARL